jgi:hypothetical protein
VNEDSRRQPSRSGANSPENTRRQHYPSGTANAGTRRIAAALDSGDTQEARDRLRLMDWREDPEADRLLEAVESGETFGGTISPTQRIALGLHAETKRKVAEARNRLGDDAA